MPESNTNEQVTDETVALRLEPGVRRQLGEEGLLVFWRDGLEPGRREGLACILSMCPHADCACTLVYVNGFLVNDNAATVCWRVDDVYLEQRAGSDPVRITPVEKLLAIVDLDSGETTEHPDHADLADPALLDWLRSEVDGELLEALHRYRARAKGYRPEGPGTDIHLDELETYHLAEVGELLDGTRSDEYVVGDRRFWAGVFVCPIPGCDCHEARIEFFDDAKDSGDAAGSVLLDISGASSIKVKKMAVECGPEDLLKDLWGRLNRRHDVGRFLRHRQAQVKEVGRTLWEPIPEPARAAPRVGRNDPCPCGSGRKYKKCCAGHADVPTAVQGSPRSN